MPLTNIQVEKAKPRDKYWKLYDEKGLYLLVRAAGHKWWRFKYRYGGRADGKPGKAEKNLSLGVFPEVSLKRAREKRDEARRRRRSRRSAETGRTPKTSRAASDV